MNLHTEIHFEREICERLAAQGWLYAENDAAGYDRSLGFISAAVTGRIEVREFLHQGTA